MTQIILASKSKGRKKVLKNLGIKFKVMPADIDERKVTATNPFLLVQKLARLKAKRIVSSIKYPAFAKASAGRQVLCKEKKTHNTKYMIHDTVIIGADSVAIIEVKRVKNKNLQEKLAKYRLGKYYLLGKPLSKSEAVTFLTTLSNNIHYFITGLYIIDTKGKAIYQSVTKTKLWFNILSREQIEKHLASIPYLKHAGAYNLGKETKEVKLVKKLKGSYTNVIGLPKEEIEKFLIINVPGQVLGVKVQPVARNRLGKKAQE